MARTTLARRLGIASSILAVSVALTACGGDDEKASDSSSDESSSSTSDDPSDESSTTETEDPSATDSEDPVDDEASGDLTELSAEEFYPAMVGALKDAESMKFTTTSVTDGMSQEMTGVLRYTDDGVEVQATASGTEGMEMVMVDKIMYMKMPGTELPAGKSWVSLDLSDPNNPFGQMLSDPETMFKAMADPKSLELVGEEDVDGEATNHYAVTFDGKEYAESLGMAGLDSMMPDEITTEMWLDSEDRLVKFVQALDMPNPMSEGETITSSTEGTYSDFGTEVDIQAPPASEVTDEMPGISMG